MFTKQSKTVSLHTGYIYKTEGLQTRYIYKTKHKIYRQGMFLQTKQPKTVSLQTRY